MATVHVVRDQKRGCGWRKPGLYLRCESLGEPCGKLPRELCVCPTCGSGIKPTRGWTWVSPANLFSGLKCRKANTYRHKERVECPRCPLSDVNLPKMGRAGLLWIGEQFYPSPEAFVKEVRNQGLSRRIKSLPHGFKLGQTWVLLAHRLGVEQKDGSYLPAIFQAFKPDRVEYVVTGDETEEELDRLEKRGLTLVRVERQQDKQEVLPL